MDASTSFKQNECLFTAVISLSDSQTVELTASNRYKKNLKRKKLKMFYFKVKALQKYLQVNRNKGMFHAVLKPLFLSLLCEEQSSSNNV